MSDLPEGLLTPTDNGVLLQLHVKPGAKRTEVGEVDQWRKALSIAVKAPPQKGAANIEVAAFLKEFFNADSVTITKGQTSHDKTVLLEGLDLDSAAAILAEKIRS